MLVVLPVRRKDRWRIVRLTMTRSLVHPPLRHKTTLATCLLATPQLDRHMARRRATTPTRWHMASNNTSTWKMTVMWTTPTMGPPMASSHLANALPMADRWVGTDLQLVLIVNE